MKFFEIFQNNFIDRSTPGWFFVHAQNKIIDKQSFRCCEIRWPKSDQMHSFLKESVNFDQSSVIFIFRRFGPLCVSFFVLKLFLNAMYRIHGEAQCS